MKRIYVATRARGFLLNLFKCKFSDIEFIYNTNAIYEVNSKSRKVIFRLVSSRLADYLGVIQRIKVKNVPGDIIFSYNRFVCADKKYVILLENPLALVHYSTYRNNTYLSRIKLKKYFSDPNLKSIICISKACYDTVKSFYSIPDRIKIDQIYPFVQANSLTSKESIRNKCRKSDIQCLYISSNFNLKGGKDILMAFNKFKALGINNIKLTIITQIKSIDKNTRKIIEENKNINLFDFKFSKEELDKFYNDSCIYLNPTRQDSFSLVTLEAMKSGNAVLTTDLYAIPEMIINNFNGYLVNPKFRFFNYDNMPNTVVWNNRRNTIYSDYIDKKIVNFLIEKILYLNENRDELERLALNSFERSRIGEFSEEFIKEKWSKLFSEI